MVLIVFRCEPLLVDWFICPSITWPSAGAGRLPQSIFTLTFELSLQPMPLTVKLFGKGASCTGVPFPESARDNVAGYDPRTGPLPLWSSMPRLKVANGFCGPQGNCVPTTV